MASTAMVSALHCTSIDPRNCRSESCSNIAKLASIAQTASSQCHGDHRHGCQRGQCLLNTGVSSKLLVAVLATKQQEFHFLRTAAIVKEQQRSTTLKMCACVSSATGSGRQRNVSLSSLGKLPAARCVWSEAGARAVRRVPRSFCQNADHW
ncbi:hypothetical protein TRVL_08221 [Trypanosoma vivax]|nr:hypothetical protein TRVL_08221 [Trypanosoma vivax]